MPANKPKSQTNEGTKNSFPGPPAQSEQLADVQISSLELGKESLTPLNPAEPGVALSDADEDFSAGEWMKQRFARGKKPRAGLREPSRISPRVPAVKTRKTSFPKEFAQE